MTTRNWDEIEKELQKDPNHEAMLAKAKAEVAAEEEAYFRALADVRRARDMTQEELAEVLGIKQTSVSKAERSHERLADLYLSTLRRFIEAMGGELLITAVFDDVEVPIDNFREIDTTNPEPPKIDAMDFEPRKVPAHGSWKKRATATGQLTDEHRSGDPAVVETLQQS